MNTNEVLKIRVKSSMLLNKIAHEQENFQSVVDFPNSIGQTHCFNNVTIALFMFSGAKSHFISIIHRASPIFYN